MTRVAIAVDDAPSLLENSGIDGATATKVGADPVWEDGSDTTYIEVEGAYFNSGATFHSLALFNVSNQSPSGLNPSNPDFKCYLSVRMSGVQPALAFPQFQIRHEGGSADLALNPATTPTTPDSPEWVTVELVGAVQQLWFTPEAYALQLRSGVMPPTGSFVTVRTWRVYEVEVYFEVPLRVAASCQNFPAETSNGVGGAVTQFPPSRAVALGHGFGGGYL